MNLQTSCSLNLIFSQPADISQAVTLLVRFLRDQGVHDQKFLAEFKGAATGAVNCAIERWHTGPDDQFVTVALTINSVEVQLEIVAPSNIEEQDGEALLTDDALASRDFSREQVMTGMGLDVDRDVVDVVILRKSLGELSWNYKSEFENPLASWP